MTTERFNLIEEPWIPATGAGRISLREAFADPAQAALGGTPLQKIALMKLLMGIAQAAATPGGESEWRAMAAEDLANQALDYLARHHDKFFLYGGRPFLQMPAISGATAQPFGAVIPEVATGNTSVLTRFQCEQALTDAERAVLLVTLMSFSLAGKKADNRTVLSEGYAGKRNDKGKPSSAKPGPGIGFLGLAHTHLMGERLIETLWLNLLTHEDIEGAGMFPEGVGTAPWEAMPEGEDCERARALKGALIGRLVPLSRFCLLTDTGMHYSEGIAHDDYKAGKADPTVAVDYSGKNPRALWADPQKRPWRELSSMLSFLSGEKGPQCLQLRACLPRAKSALPVVGVWSGGLRVSSNAGEQFVSGSDDHVESLVWVESAALDDFFVANLAREMQGLEQLSSKLWSSVTRYAKAMKDTGKGAAGEAQRQFWQLCERDFQSLLRHCDPSEEGRLARDRAHRRFAHYVHSLYDRTCPRQSARQIDAWAKARPNTADYIKEMS